MNAKLRTLSDRLEILELPDAAATTSFAQDVRRGLSAARKHLASKYLYDDLGSALFDAITKLPEYYLTRAETEILHECGWEIVRALDAPLEFVELGSGSAIKTRLLIEEALRVQGSLRYSPIDISKDALYSSATTLVDAYPQLLIRGYVGDYFTVLNSSELQFEKTVLAMFMGSNIGNYQPKEAIALLTLIASALRPGDGLLLGADLKKDRAILEAAYDDPAGVTAAFDKNVLGRINRELGGTFDLRAFDHVALYDAQRGCVDSYLQSRCDQHISIESLGFTASFARGERLHMESSYKFDNADIKALAASCGFTLSKSWHDQEDRYSLQLLVREG